MARIVLVEDNAANARLAEFVLGTAGHEVLVAADAPSGIALAARERPDLVLMDVQLPGMDGLEATRRLRSDPATRAIPVVMLTAYAMRGDDEKMRAAGCDGCVSKPFRYAELLAAVEAVLRGRETRE